MSDYTPHQRFAERLLQQTLDALNTCTSHQRSMYELVHGITSSGEQEPVTTAAAARTLGIGPSTAVWHLREARLAVSEAIAQWLIAQEMKRIDEEAMPLPGASTHEHAAISVTHDRRYYTEESVRLGEGSEAMTRAAKHADPKRRASASVAAHIRYATR